MDDYFLGDGEAPGVWHGRSAAALGLYGVVDAEPLRRLVEVFHPLTGEELLSGSRPRRVHAFDATFSAPKSVSLLWAFGTEESASVVSIAHVEATTPRSHSLKAGRNRAPTGQRRAAAGADARVCGGHVRASHQPRR